MADVKSVRFVDNAALCYYIVLFHRVSRICKSQNYTREMSAKNVFEIQTEICRIIASELKTVLSPEEQKQIEKLPTQNLAALETYFKGKSEPHTRAGMEASISYYKRAISLDPDFALAYMELANDQIELATRSGNSEYREKAEQNVMKALELDDTSSETYTALSFLRNRQGNHKAAIAASKKALEINPNNARAWWQLGGLFASIIGDAKEAAEYLRKAYELNPNTPQGRRGLANSLENSGEYEAALGILEDEAAENPTYADAHFYLSGIYRRLGRYDDSIVSSRKKLALDPRAIQTFRIISGRYFNLGDKETALWWHQTGDECQR